MIPMDEHEPEYCGCNVEAQNGYDIMEQRLMQMTFWAHKTVLFEKLKERIGKQEGENLDRLVDLLIANSKAQAQSSKAAAQKSRELKDALKEAFPN